MENARVIAKIKFKFRQIVESDDQNMREQNNVKKIFMHGYGNECGTFAVMRIRQENIRDAMRYDDSLTQKSG